MTTKKPFNVLLITIVLACSSIISMFLGIIRDRIYTSYFTAQQLDPFYAAFKLPDFIFQIFVIGIIGATLIPNLLDTNKNDSKESYYDLLFSIFNLGSVILLFSSILLFFLTPVLLPLFTPGFDVDRLIQTTKTTRILLLSPFFMGIASIIGFYLHSKKNFFITALTPIFYNLGIIISTLVFKNNFGIEGLATGVVIGSFLYLSILIPVIVLDKTSAHYRPCFFHPRMKTIGVSALPRIVTLTLSQIGTFVDTALASPISGGVTIFAFAFKIQNMPTNIFSLNTSSAVFPVLVEHAAEKDWDKYNSVLIKALHQVLFFILPISIILFMFPEQIVKIFAAAKFSHEDVLLIAFCIIIFSISIAAQGLTSVLVKAYYALHDTFTPLIAVVISLAIKIIGAFFFISLFHSIIALPLSYSISEIINTIILLALLQKKTHCISRKSLLQFLNLTIPCFLLLILEILAKYLLFPTLPPRDNVLSIIFLAIVSIVGLLFYLIVAYLLKIPESKMFIEGSRRRLLKIAKLVIKSDVIEQ